MLEIMPILAVLSTIVLALILLSFLVLIHELGHFLAAKWAGVHVEEFGLGYPPRVRTLFTWWETKFSINAVPIGGFVKLYGDDAELIEGKLATDAQIPSSSAFVHKSVFQRLVIILAGVVVNFIFGILAFSAIYSATGIPTVTSVFVGNVSESSPAAEKGLQANDTLLKVGKSGELQTVRDIDHFVGHVSKFVGSNVTLTYSHEGEERTVDVYVRREDERPAGQGGLGIALDQTVDFRFYPWYEMPFRGAVAGLQDTWYLAKMMIDQLREMVVKLVVQQEAPKELSGPIGIIDQTYKSEILKQGWVGRLRWMAVLSISLGVMNLLPIPVLDGGRALFVLAEPALGRERRLRWEQKANSFGFLFLIALIFLVSAKDIFMIFAG